MGSSYVFDSSTFIAILRRENGSSTAEGLIDGAIISTVNYSEVVTKLSDWGYSDSLIKAALGNFDLGVIEFDLKQAFAAAALREKTRAKGLSLGDRACLALAQTSGRIALTADRAWADLEIDVDVELIR